MGAVKGCLVAEGSKQLKHMPDGVAALPTVMTESAFITATIKTNKLHDVAVFDLSGAFPYDQMEKIGAYGPVGQAN